MVVCTSESQWEDAPGGSRIQKESHGFPRHFRANKCADGPVRAFDEQSAGMQRWRWLMGTGNNHHSGRPYAGNPRYKPSSKHGSPFPRSPTRLPSVSARCQLRWRGYHSEQDGLDHFRCGVHAELVVATGRNDGQSMVSPESPDVIPKDCPPLTSPAHEVAAIPCEMASLRVSWTARVELGVISLIVLAQQIGDHARGKPTSQIVVTETRLIGAHVAEVASFQAVIVIVVGVRTHAVGIPVRCEFRGAGPILKAGLVLQQTPIIEIHV